MHESYSLGRQADRLVVSVLRPEDFDLSVLNPQDGSGLFLECSSQSAIHCQVEYQTAGWIGLDDFLAQIQLDGKESCQFLYDLFSALAVGMKNQPVILDPEAILLSFKGDQIALLRAPLILECWMKRADEIDQFLLSLMDKLPCSQYEILGLLWKQHTTRASFDQMAKAVETFYQSQIPKRLFGRKPTLEPFGLRHPVFPGSHAPTATQKRERKKFGRIKNKDPAGFSPQQDLSQKSSSDQSAFADDSGVQDPGWRNLYLQQMEEMPSGLPVYSLNESVRGSASADHLGFPDSLAASPFGHDNPSESHYESGDGFKAGSGYSFGFEEGQDPSFLDTGSLRNQPLHSFPALDKTQDGDGFQNAQRDLSRSQPGALSFQEESSDQEASSWLQDDQPQGSMKSDWVYPNDSKDKLSSDLSSKEKKFTDNFTATGLANPFESWSPPAGLQNQFAESQQTMRPNRPPVDEQRGLNVVSYDSVPYIKETKESGLKDPKESGLKGQTRKEDQSRNTDSVCSDWATPFLQGCQPENSALHMQTMTRRPSQSMVQSRPQNDEPFNLSIDSSIEPIENQDPCQQPFASKMDFMDSDRLSRREQRNQEAHTVLLDTLFEPCFLEISGMKYALQGMEMVVGRSADCQIRLLDGSVSQHHARLIQIDGRWYVQDLKSTNSTLLCGRKVIRRMRLKEGMVLQFGNQKAVFHGQPLSAH